MRLPVGEAYDLSSDGVPANVRASRSLFRHKPCLGHGWALHDTTECLLADPKLSDDIAIPVCVALLQVVKQTTTLAYQHEQSTT